MSSRTVLVVDDLPFARKVLTEILVKAHYQVVGEAKNGKEAIQLYRELRPEIVTMDIVMPVMSGIDATRTIMKMDPDGKVIMVSAMNQESLVMEAVAAGAKDYVTKPFTADDIVKAVNRLISQEDSNIKSAV